MKTKLLLMMMLVCTSLSYSQSIGLVGSGANGWPSGDLPAPQPDAVMTSSDNVNYTLSNYALSNGEVKFRQDLMWATNWGSAAFPVGTGTQNGTNIPTTAGMYNITFKRTTGEYVFTALSSNPAISMIGSAITAATPLLTDNGINYYKNNQAFTNGNLQFSQTAPTAMTWGGNTFPNGNATVGGGNIPVVAKSYNVRFNKNTGAYNFDFLRVGLIGAGAAGWSVDTNMNTTDGINYTLSNFVIGGTGGSTSEVKFRQNNDWLVQWGNNAFPSGTGLGSGNDPAIPAMPGTYNITMNRSTGAYNFVVLSTNEFQKNNLKVFPNPSKNNWTFVSAESEITSISITDVLGKVVFTQNAFASEVVVDGSNLPNGLYFAKIISDTKTTILKVVKN